ncbi:MAG TPA: hypothetical protein VLF89_01285 [Candidatus Saccharimonadales bacterium]|nr:hypothetical protein [Candidatus Saccharimonadales bacterium]
MKKIIVILFLFLTFISSAGQVSAIENPLAKPNNKFGIHILFPAEVAQAAQLVNSSGGSWGYVVIPIQSGDRDLIKWQLFMDTCKKNHVIPIVRVATEGDYFNTKVWRVPDASDILDFANFLNSLDWPVKNRYVIIFNEVNRADEFGGVVDPGTYAKLLSYATTVFKSKNQDFFVISSGMDNAAANTPFSMDEYDYFRAMQQSVPGIFNQIDGISSHAYPNPGFSQPPTVLNAKSIDSFQYERTLIETMSNKQLPVFITETGWPTNVVPDTVAAGYYQQAFSTVWNDPNIVTVAPFLLQANGGPFSGFSFLSISNSQTPEYTAIASIPKTKGTPSAALKVLGEEIAKIQKLPLENFSHINNTIPTTQVSHSAKTFFKWLLGLQ